jgi:Protein of unknown function (DUF2971)
MEFHLVTEEKPPATLYHYTSLETLVAIVGSRTIRASGIRFLNDRSEAQRLKEEVASVLRAERQFAQIAESTIEQIENFPRQSLFVASLTEKDDLLSQWRAYCPSALGVSIGFSTDSLQEQFIANPTGAKPLFLSAALQKVRYYETDHRQELTTFLERLAAIEQESSSGTSMNSGLFAILGLGLSNIFGIKDTSLLPSAAEIETAAREQVDGATIAGRRAGVSIATWVHLAASIFKHEAFQEECEWRKVISKDSRLMPGQKFRAGRSTLIPFVEVMLDVRREGAECVPREAYFINEVVVGPTPTPELTHEALVSLFASVGHPEVRIRVSRIPYKDW